MMNKTLYIILINLILTGCGKYFTYSSYDDVFLSSDSKVIGKITLDNSYLLYVRSAYEAVNGETKTLETNEVSIDTAKDKLIEIEYLLISKSKRNVIYISTISDQYKNRYSKRNIPLNAINVFDFKVILFGKLNDKNEILFISKDMIKTDSWKIKDDPDKTYIEIEGITERSYNEFQLYIPVQEALKDKIIFNAYEDYNIIFRMFLNNDDNKSILNLFRNEDNPDIPIFTGTIYFRKQCGWLLKRRCKKMIMYFPFNKSVIKGGSLANIYFNNQRIGSYPNNLFDK